MRTPARDCHVHPDSQTARRPRTSRETCLGQQKWIRLATLIEMPAKPAPSDREALPLGSSAAPWSIDDALRCRDARSLALSEVPDALIADLVRKRLWLERAQGFGLLGTFAFGLVAVLGVGTQIPSPALLGITAALTASLGLSFGIAVDRAAWHWFWAKGRAQGLSEPACRQIFERACRAEKLVEVLSSCGREISDHDLANFVR